MKYVTVTPAYGRDYKSGKEAKEAWLAGKDFVYQAPPFDPDSGRYCSVRDFDAKTTTVNIRYKRMQQVAVVKGGAR